MSALVTLAIRAASATFAASRQIGRDWLRELRSLNNLGAASGKHANSRRARARIVRRRLAAGFNNRSPCC